VLQRSPQNRFVVVLEHAVQGIDDVVAAVLARMVPVNALDTVVDPFGLIGVFSQLATARATGRLELDRENGVWRHIYFIDGRPVYAASELLSENFGQILLRRGVITEVEYQWARRLQEQEGVRQGEALVKIGVLSRRALYRLLRAQIRQKIVNARSEEHTSELQSRGNLVCRLLLE